MGPRWKACLPKRRYTNEEEAKIAAHGVNVRLGLGKKNQHKIRAYECWHCTGQISQRSWHIGHKPSVGDAKAAMVAKQMKYRRRKQTAAWQEAHRILGLLDGA